MIPGGLRNLDPKAMQRMMHQLGIKNEEIGADRVIIESKNGRIIIDNPTVTAIDMAGKKTYTVMGEERTEDNRGISKEDIQMVMKQAGASEKKAEAALKKNDGDIAAAILELKGEV